MGVVTRSMLHRHMSEPRWTPAQEQEADRTCEAVERDLEAALFGAVITPQLRVEAAPIDRDGRIDTQLPVHTVLELDGAPVAEGAPLPEGYDLRQGWLYLTSPTVLGSAGALAVGWPWVAPVDLVPAYTGGVLHIRYMGGWGPEPALVEAILNKAAVRMSGRHADTVVLSGLNATPSPSSQPRHWTEQDLAPLARFRNLGWGSRR